jgi:hypothetical protein
MKKLLSFLLVATCLTFTSCLDTIDELTIAADGSGVYKSTMDMGGMFEMLEMAAAMDPNSGDEIKKLTGKSIDSSVRLQSVVDTASNLNEEQKRLFRDAQMSFVIKKDEKVFKLGMTYPFKHIEDVQKIMELNSQGKGVGMYGKQKKEQAMLPGMDEMGEMPSLAKAFDVTIKKGLIERKLNDEKYKSFKDDEKMKDLGAAKDMISGVKFTTVIHLPSPVTKATGDAVKVSDDKKTVMITTTLLELLDNPKALAFRIEY